MSNRFHRLAAVPTRSTMLAIYIGNNLAFAAHAKGGLSSGLNAVQFDGLHEPAKVLAQLMGVLRATPRARMRLRGASWQIGDQNYAAR